MNIIEKPIEYLNEISHGIKEVRFAYIDPETGKAITQFCRCKDYFNDLFWSIKLNKDVKIYGFKWNPKTDPSHLLKNKMLFVALKISNRENTNPLKIEKSQVDNLRKFFSLVESNLNLKETKFSTSDDNKYIIVSYDKDWSKIPYLNSAFFLFLRMGLTYNSKGKDIFEFYLKNISNFISPCDASYFKAASEKIKDIIEGKIDKSQTYEQYEHSTIHSHSGLVSYKNYKIS